MKDKSKFLWLLVCAIFLFSCGENTEQMTDRLSKATSGIAVNKTLEEAKDSPMGKAYKNLTDGKPSSMEIILIKKGDAKTCSSKGIKKLCAEVSRFKDPGKGRAKAEKSTTTITAVNWKNINGSYGHFLMNGKLYAAKYVQKTNQMYIAEASSKTLLKGYKGFRLKADKSDVSAYVIPPSVWDWWTDTEGNCCMDCFATHRGWGLPCAADAACCAGQCSISDPSCDGGGDDGGGAFPPGDDDDDDNNDCGDSYITDSATVETNGYTCQYSGEVTPTRTEDGNCQDVATNGMVFNCVPTSLVGNSPPPAETEDIGGGYY